MLKFWKVWILLLVHGTIHAQVQIYGEPEPVRSVNSPQMENYLYVRGNELFFTREKYIHNTGGRMDPGDIWVGSLDSGKLQSVPFNTPGFTSPIGILDNKYFMFNEVVKDLGRHVGKIWAVPMNNRGFGQPREVKIPYLRNQSPAQSACLSFDGRYMVLSLEELSGYGVEDLYVCQLRPDGTWSAPKNLGYTLNTPLQEVTPFLAPDNKTLFYATNSGQGKGSFDIYYSLRLDDTWRQWSTPVNMGDRINTTGAETSFCFEPGSDYAYFVSTKDSDGYGDINRIRITADFEAVATYTSMGMVLTDVEESNETLFFVVNARTREFLNGSVVILQAGGDTLQVSANNGIRLSAGDDPLKLEFKVANFLSAAYTLNSSQDTVLIELEPLNEGNVIGLEHVLFYRGTANFVEGSEEELDLVVEMMNENKDIRILLKGHTDNYGDPVLNLQLSQERVNAVMHYLASHGISSSRLEGKGYGGSVPIASNETEETRKLNRRVEFEILKR